MHDDDTAGSTCADPAAEASPARGQSPVGQRNPAASMSRRDRSSVGNVGGAGSREPLQGLDGVCRRVSRGSARSLAHGAVRVPQTGCRDVGDGAICRARGHCLFFCGAKIRKKEDYFMKVGNTFNVNMTGSLSLIRKSVMR